MYTVYIYMYVYMYIIYHINSPQIGEITNDQNITLMCKQILFKGGLNMERITKYTDTHGFTLRLALHRDIFETIHNLEKS